MKSICFESYRQSKKEKYFQNKPKPKPKSLDPSWYTDNIYSNRSIDLDEEYIPECIRYGTWKRLRNISEQDEYFDESGSHQNLQRSTSCKDFKYPKSQSCCFGGRETKSSKSSVPKSYSFSVNSSKIQPFDVIDYEPPPPSRRDKKMMRKSMDYYCHDSHPNCCAREHCTNAKCLLEEIYNYNRRTGRDRRPYAGQNNIRRNLMTEWDERNRKIPPRSLNVCDEYCYRRTQSKKRPCSFTPTHNDNFEEHFHCSSDFYETDVDHFIRDERSRLMSQDKFLDDDEHYLRTEYHPIRNKSMLEVQPPSKYDEDTCSESTEMDLEDFNFDLEKYWEELEKPPSPIDLDMQQRNMNTNMKVKNVNVGCYNNGTPIDIHDREHERMMIKKSLLEGMPSPPQNNLNDFHCFDYQRGSPLFHRSHKVYPETIPSYKYNNFYPQDHLHPNNICQPQSTNGHSALSLINNIFSIYKPNKYSPLNCQLNKTKPEPCKKMNVPSTIRPLGAPHSEFMHSMKRPLIVSTEQPQFKIIPEKTGLKISPFYRFDFGDKQKHKLTSTARPLLFPH